MCKCQKANLDLACCAQKGFKEGGRGNFGKRMILTKESVSSFPTILS